MHVQPSDVKERVRLQTEFLRDLPRRLQWIVLLQNALVPYIFYVIVTVNTTASTLYMFVAWLGLLFCSSATVFAANRRRRLWQAYGPGFALSIVFSVVWVIYLDNWFPAAVFPVVVVLTSYRIYRLFDGSFVGDQSRAAFRLDSWLVVLALFVCAGVTGTSGTTFDWVCLNGLFAMVARLYTMWSIERVKHESEHASRTTWIWLGTSLAIVLIFGPKVVYYLCVAVIYLIGLVVSPLSWLLPTDWHLPALKKPSEYGSSVDNQLYATIPIRHNSMISWFGIVFVIAAIVLLTLIITHVARRRSEMQGELLPAVTTRRWLGGSNHLKMLETNHPVRLQLQRWILKQDEQGNRLQPHETSTQFMQRTREDRPGAVDADIQELQEQYQKVRYRLADQDS